MRETEFRLALLEWYDHHAREMPWRVGPSDRKNDIGPDPYRVWISEIMLQQTTVAAVRDYFLRFMELWPTINDLASATDDAVMAEWAGLGYYARARNLLKCARLIVSDFDGRFPREYKQLLHLPGIGPYTAAAVCSIAFDQPQTVVDGNVERVVSRLFDVAVPLPDSKPELTRHAANLTPQDRPGDYAQAMMDLGAVICTPRNPSCGICPVAQFCKARHSGTQSTLPKKRPKPKIPTRYGTVYVARRTDGAWLLERRPDKGLLGGTLGWPGSDWTASAQELPPLAAEWTSLGPVVRHTFTHFHLVLILQTAIVPADADPAVGFFVQDYDFRASALPTIMRKAYDLAAPDLDSN